MKEDIRGLPDGIFGCSSVFVLNRNGLHILIYGLETKNKMEAVGYTNGASGNFGGLVCRKGGREKRKCRKGDAQRAGGKGK